MLRESDCVPLFRYWISQGNKVCDTLCLPLDAACAALLPWRFSGRGAIGTMFKDAAFPYSITGSLARFHGEPVTRETIAFMQMHIAIYSRHPLSVIAMHDTFNNTRCEMHLMTLMDALWHKGPLAFYRAIFRVEQPKDTIRVQQGTDTAKLLESMIVKFEITQVPTVAGRSPNGTVIVRFPAVPCIDIKFIGDGSADTITWECLDQAVVSIILHSDAVVLRLFIPQLDFPFVLQDIKYE